MDFAIRRQGSPAQDGRKKRPSQHADGTIVHVVPSRYLRWSAGINRALAALLLLPGLPVIGLLILVVRLSSKGPGIYRQVRVGYHGRLFDVLKIRTMREDAESGTGAVWTSEKDPRITRIGWFLRWTHLDELPQLFNVVKGEMNLIGPRPERPEFTEHLAEEIPDYLQRVNVRPGVTGLAQINLPPDTDTDSVRRKLILDLKYVHTATFGMDVRIFFATAFRIIGVRGTLPARLLRVYEKVHLPTDIDPEQSPESVLPRIALSAAEIKAASRNGRASHNGPTSPTNGSHLLETGHVPLS